MLKDRSFGLNLLSENAFKFKNLLVMQNFKIVFNSIGGIIPLSEKWVGSHEKGCFRLKVFVQVFSQIYVGMKKSQDGLV